MSINVIVLVGHAGRDPELRFFESGSCVCEFSLAVNRPPRDGQNQEPLWVNCKAWGKTAQVAGDYLRKGSKVAIVGRLEIEQWSDRSSGEVRSKTLVVIERLELCGSRRDGESFAAGAGGPAPSGGAAALPAAAPSGAAAASGPVGSSSAGSSPAGSGRANPQGWGSDWTSTPAGGTPLSDEEVPF
jgi:single-strand DNA-binding protein